MTGEKKKHDLISDITQNPKVLSFDVWIRICFLGGIESSRVQSSCSSTSRGKGRDERDEPGLFFWGEEIAWGKHTRHHFLVSQRPCEWVFVPSQTS